MDRNSPPKWATHKMINQANGEFCFLGKGIIAAEWRDFDEWEDPDYSEEWFKDFEDFGWVITPLKPIVLENK